MSIDYFNIFGILIHGERLFQVTFVSTLTEVLTFIVGLCSLRAPFDIGDVIR